MCLQDQFDTVDFSDNDIHKLDGFLLLNNNCFLLVLCNVLLLNNSCIV